MYVHKLLVNRLFEPAQEKVWLGELTVPPWPQLLTWDVKQQNKTKKDDVSTITTFYRLCNISYI